MIHWVEQFDAPPSRKAVAVRKRRKSGAFVGDAPHDLDEQLSRVRVLPRWIGVCVALAIAGGLWTLIIMGVWSLLT